MYSYACSLNNSPYKLYQVSCCFILFTLDYEPSLILVRPIMYNVHKYLEPCIRDISRHGYITERIYVTLIPVQGSTSMQPGRDIASFQSLHVASYRHHENELCYMADRLVGTQPQAACTIESLTLTTTTKHQPHNLKGSRSGMLKSKCWVGTPCFCVLHLSVPNI